MTGNTDPYVTQDSPQRWEIVSERKKQYSKFCNYRSGARMPGHEGVDQEPTVRVAKCPAETHGPLLPDALEPLGPSSS